MRLYGSKNLSFHFELSRPKYGYPWYYKWITHIQWNITYIWYVFDTTSQN